MKGKLFLLPLFLSLFLFTNLSAQTEQDMQKAWMEYMTPGEMHKGMAESVGEWKTETKMWMDPAAEPMVSEGSSTNEMVMGGRYLQAKHSMMVMGQPMEGVSLVGYDNAKKEFVSIWYDNMGTGISYSTGKYDPATKTITLNGTMVDPSTGKDMPFKENYKMIDENNEFMEMFNIVDGKEVKSMEVKMTRK